MTSDLQDRLARWEARVGRDGSCHDERDQFLTFCAQYKLTATADAVALYLVHLLETRSRSVAALRYRVRLLDLSAVLAGEPPPSRDRSLRLFLRGLHRTLADGTENSRTPLYLEDIDALLYAVDRDRTHQLRDIAFVLLADTLPVPVDVIRQLQWHQLRLRKNQLVLDLPQQQCARGPRGQVSVPEGGGPTCPVRAMGAWSRHVGPANGYVFATRGHRTPGMKRAAELLAPLPSRGPQWRGPPAPAGDDILRPYLELLDQPRPRELRDRAIITLAFAACLTSDEARRLRVSHISQVPQGLLVHVPGRSGPVGVPRAAVARRCAVSAWQAWLAKLQDSGLDSDLPAFPRVQEQAITSSQLDGYAPTWLLLRRCEQAGLRGNYGFTSLRIGFIRTAARTGVPEQVILRQAGLSRMDSVLLHVRREQLVSHTVAGQLGL